MAFTIQNNTPSAGMIQWTDLNLVYLGQTYAIQDGYTNAIYAYWTPTYPNNLVVTNTFPTLGPDDALLFLNKNGIALVVPTATILDGGLVVPGSIFASSLAANTITGDKIAASTVTSTNIAANTITAGDIATGTISARLVAADAIGAEAIAAGAIAAEHIVADAITTDKIAANAVTANEMAVGTITAASGIIGDAAITTANIGDSQITSAKIANATITTADIGTSQITSALIANATITNADIANATIITAKIADAQITNAKIANVDASKITTGTIDAARIGADSITSQHLNVLAKSIINNFSNTGSLEAWAPTTGMSLIPDPSTSDNRGTVMKMTSAGSTYTNCEYAEIDPTKDYKFNVSITNMPAGYVQTINAAHRLFLLAYFYDKDKNVLSAIPINTSTRAFGTATTAPTLWSSAAGAAVSGWKDIETYFASCTTEDAKKLPNAKLATLFVKMPANAKYVRVQLRNYYNTASCDAFFFGPSITEIGLGTINAEQITAGMITGVDITSDDGAGNIVEITTGTVTTTVGGKKRFDMKANGLTAYHWVDETAVAVFRTEQRIWEGGTVDNGAAIMGMGDYLAVGKIIDGDVGISLLSFNWTGSYPNTQLYGGAGDTVGGYGRLTLRSVYNYGEVGGSDGNIPQITIDSVHTDSDGMDWVGIRANVGRSNLSPASSSVRAGFEVWQYRGDGTSAKDMLLQIDTNDTGVQYADWFVDRMWVNGEISCTGNLRTSGLLQVDVAGMLIGADPGGGAAFSGAGRYVFSLPDGWWELGYGVGANILKNNQTRIVMHTGGPYLRVESWNGGYCEMQVGKLYQTSDRDQKKNIVPYQQSAIDEILTTPIYEYNLLDDVDGVDFKQVGIVVQESPMQVVNQRFGNSVDVYAMSALSWKAIQELNAKIEALETKITALQNGAI